MAESSDDRKGTSETELPSWSFFNPLHPPVPDRGSHFTGSINTVSSEADLPNSSYFNPTQPPLPDLGSLFTRLNNTLSDWNVDGATTGAEDTQAATTQPRPNSSSKNRSNHHPPSSSSREWTTLDASGSESKRGGGGGGDETKSRNRRRPRHDDADDEDGYDSDFNDGRISEKRIRETRETVTDANIMRRSDCLVQFFVLGFGRIDRDVRDCFNSMPPDTAVKFDELKSYLTPRAAAAYAFTKATLNQASRGRLDLSEFLTYNDPSNSAIVSRMPCHIPPHDYENIYTVLVQLFTVYVRESYRSNDARFNNTRSNKPLFDHEKNEATMQLLLVVRERYANPIRTHAYSRIPAPKQLFNPRLAFS